MLDAERQAVVADAATQCCGQAQIADVSAVADPNTGVAVYDSTSYQGRSGWQVYGGTSASVADHRQRVRACPATRRLPGVLPCAHTAGLNDVTSGTNGTCAPAIWCTAGAGWDGPTGLGTPNGTSAF